MWMLDDTTPFQEHTGMGYASAVKSGSTAPTTAAPLVAGAGWSSILDNTHQIEFEVPNFVQGRESGTFAIETWILPIPGTTTGDQKLMSHASAYDGLTINGTVVSFSTHYLTADPCVCSFDLQIPRAAHVAGIHTAEQNFLYVNGVLVDNQYLTDAQKVDSYVATDGKLYAGESASNQKVAMNAAAFYAIANGDTFALNFDAGRRVVPQAQIAPQFGGKVFNMAAASGAQFLERTWAVASDFRQGLIDDIAIDTDAIYPQYIDGLSVAGSWTIGVPLDGTGATSIYGVMAEWSAVGVTVESSIDGISWDTAVSGELIPDITNGMDPTGLDLQLRFSFAGGLANDPAFIESVTVIGFTANTFQNSEMRTITAGHPAVLRKDYEPIEYREDNGVNLQGATLTIGADSSASPTNLRTLELWIKPTATPSIGVSGTQYRNGAVDSTIPLGQWSLIHIVTASDFSTSFTITGDCIVGQVGIYATPLTADNISHIFKSYTGYPIISVTDSDAFEVSESVTPVLAYAQSWSIDGAGG